MPFTGKRKRGFSTTGPRYTKKRKLTYKRRRRGPNVWAPLPKQRMVKFKYVQEMSLNPGPGVAAGNIFSANGLFDPDITGIGHQPYGFDELMQHYDHYTVVGSKCTLRSINNNSFPFWAMVLLRDTNTTVSGTTTQVLLEQPGNKAQLIGYNDGGHDKATVKAFFSAKKFFNIRNFIGKSAYRGDSAANPTEQAYFHVVIAPNSVGDDLSGQALWVEIEYTAVLTEPRILGPS